MGYYEYSLKSGFALASFQRMIPLFARDFPISACVCSFRVTSRQERFGDLARSGSIHSNQAVILPNPFPFIPFLASGPKGAQVRQNAEGNFFDIVFFYTFHPPNEYMLISLDTAKDICSAFTLLFLLPQIMRIVVKGSV